MELVLVSYKLNAYTHTRDARPGGEENYRKRNVIKKNADEVKVSVKIFI